MSENNNRDNMGGARQGTNKSTFKFDSQPIAK